MNLTKEQLIELQKQFIEFVEKVHDIMGDTKFSNYYKIPLNNCLSEYSGLAFEIRTKDFACYSTDRTRSSYLWYDTYDMKSEVSYGDETLYRKYKKGNISYEKVVLDILKQKEYIYRKLKERIQHEQDYVNSILGI